MALVEPVRVYQNDVGEGLELGVELVLGVFFEDHYLALLGVALDGAVVFDDEGGELFVLVIGEAEEAQRGFGELLEGVGAAVEDGLLLVAGVDPGRGDDVDA